MAGMMYEKIMDLPLFKGVSEAHVSAFLASTHLEFKTYKAGDLIIRVGDPTNALTFVLSGEVSLLHSNVVASMSLQESRGEGAVIGADSLFGIDQTDCATVSALSDVGVMRISKTQYCNLLMQDEIYRINYFNYLSLRSQRMLRAIRHLSEGTVREFLSLLIMSFTTADSRDIRFVAEDGALAGMLHRSGQELMAELRKLRRQGLISIEGKNILIKDRLSFIEHANF